MTPPPGPDLSRLVAEAVREALADVRQAGGAGPTAPLAASPAVSRPVGEAGGPGGRRQRRSVRITNDRELADFTRELLHLLDNPRTREDLRNGWLTFTLTGGGAAARQTTAAGGGGATRVERGAVTERHVVEAARRGGTLVVARGAVITPLARDKARSLGLTIHKEK